MMKLAPKSEASKESEAFSILITGPESSGKTTLARDLAFALDGLYVEEAARAYLLERNGDYSAADLPAIWQKQKEAEDAARATSASFVICDTGPEVIRIWAEVKYGSCPEEVLHATKTRHYDLILLCYPDLPWEEDSLREAPEANDRLALFELYQRILPTERTVVVRGINRLAQALSVMLPV
ncbi:ATP-binding protein [Neolewinella agarilytica]|uniref:ATP-binding protein n=1 Tax=Neolewinella agarilytica TaxID=478744 RepID=UPI0023522A2B|nr:ATP-binding protein [Neolewinella agarilytica]